MTLAIFWRYVCRTSRCTLYRAQRAGGWITVRVHLVLGGQPA
jgi:hypothetical protein